MSAATSPVIIPAFEHPMQLGEAPLWLAAEQALYWIDISACELHRLQPATDRHRQWALPSTPGCLVPADGGGLVLALRQGLTIQLQQSPFLALTSNARIQQLLQLMREPADARLTPALAREICEREGGGAVLEGSIANLGAQYVLGVRASGCRSRR